MDRIGKWRIKVHNTFKQINDCNNYNNSIDILVELINEGEEFNLKMSEMDLLQKVKKKLFKLFKVTFFLGIKSFTMAYTC